MEAWVRRFWEDDQSYFIRSEYKKLLQLGMTDAQAEEQLTAYCLRHLSDSPADTHRMYIALALAQWEMGRMTEICKENALNRLYFLQKVYDDTLLKSIEIRLRQAMPSRLTVSKASERRCPWREGSLLAYRIQNNEDCSNSPYWHQYVLLRVVRLVRWPHSIVVPDKCYSETMLVGLYDWFGENIPGTEEIKRLQFTPICVEQAQLRQSHFAPVLPKLLASIDKTTVESLLQRLTTGRVETCYSLIWDRKCKQDGTLTFLGCNPDFLDDDFVFCTELTDYSMGGPCALDGALCRRLKELYGQ